MSALPTHPEVAVIGAGAAGLAAGRELWRLGVSFVILEARDRVGGRAWTVPHGASAPLDLGCEWLHSGSRNVLADLAPEFGFDLDKSDPPWMRPARQEDFSAADAEAFYAAYGAFDDRLAAAAEEAERTGQDRAASDFLDPLGRWNARLDAIATFYHGAPLERVSVVDYGRYIDTGENWRVRGGYGALIAATGADLPVKLGCAVRKIDATGRRIKIETSSGALECGAVIVTVPTNVLASGAIAFSPALDAHLAAAAGLPLGIADKLYLALDTPGDFEPDTRAGGDWNKRDSGSYTLLPGGRPMIEGYFGGDYARSLEDGGLPAFVSAARDDLARAFGASILPRLTPIVATSWARDPLALGSYSHALPGQADARAVLATPVDGRIFFAGEAVSRHFFSTAHGAFETGVVAAQAAAGGVERL
ncbi:MAG: NAD(P)/FAD-dependent oxidoreductase [Beijerinckiaceae bacterium]|jgi:monoamine oxidase